MVKYICNGCSFETTRKSTIENHVNRMNQCDFKSDEKYSRFDEKQVKRYEEIVKIYEDKDCKLITSLSEFLELVKTNKVTRDIKVKYLTICGHENITTTRYFVDQNYINCKDCTLYQRHITNFENKGCKLLTSVEEFNTKRKDKDEVEDMTVDYIAQCGHQNDIRLSSFAIGCGLTCKKCNRTKLYSTSEIIEKFKEVHGDLYLYDKVKYINTDTKVEIGCKVHGYFKQTPHGHLQKDGCSRCTHKSESECIIIMEKVSGYKFDKIKPKFLNGMELDGYNFELNLAIEYNGKQHYDYIPHFHRNGQIDLIKQQERDNLKAELCKENNIYLIVVPYWIEDIDDFLIEKYNNFEFLNSYN